MFLIKILNHFGSSYSILHDSDLPTAKRKVTPGIITNPAWTLNQKILDAVSNRPVGTKVRLIASMGNFEKAFLDEEVSVDKPYNALINMRNNADATRTITELLTALIDHSAKVPDGALEWTSIEQLKERITLLYGEENDTTEERTLA
ncbi:MAG: hypothetical protein P4L69_19505 [Desulfosporosinus sp.]|nr:hypothetical protein [Desulfosporosinus sp.]